MAEIEEVAETRLDRIGGSGRGGVPAIVWAFVAVLVAVVGFAAAGDQLSGKSAAPSGVAADQVSPSARPSPSPGRRGPPPSPTVRPFLPPIPRTIIPGAPRIALGSRVGDDLVLRTWRSGQAVFETTGVHRAAFAGLAAEVHASMDLSPNGGSGAIVLQTVGPDGPTTARVRIVSLAGASGDPLWESGELEGPPTLTWAPDGSTLAVGGGPTWTLVRLAPDGAATATTIAIAAEPVPSTSPSAGAGLDPRGPDRPSSASYPIPIAFSADGRSLYGARFDEASFFYLPAVGVTLGSAEPIVSPIDRYPTSETDRPVPTGYPGDRVDPTTGRIADLVRRMPLHSPDLVIHEPGHAAPIVVEPPGGWRFSSPTWVGDSRLLALLELPFGFSALSPDAFEVELRPINADGSLGDVALFAERVTSAEIVASRPGYVVLAFQAEESVMFVVLRADDGATASVRLRTDDLADLVALDLIDPLTRRQSPR